MDARAELQQLCSGNDLDINKAILDLAIRLSATLPGYYAWRWNPQTDELSAQGFEGLPCHGDLWAAQIFEQDKARVLATRQKHLEGKTPFYKAAYRVICKDGSCRHILSIGLLMAQDLMTGAYIDLAIA
jgi:hypothetical protein